MPVDEFASQNLTRKDFGTRHAVIVPNDTADFPTLPKIIYCQVAGTVVARDQAGNDLPYTLVAGQILPIRPVRVLATGTTGTYYGIY